MKTNWPTKKLGEVADFLDSKRRPVTASARIPGPYPYYGANGQQDSVNDYIFDDELVLLAEDGGYFGSKDRPVAYRISGKSWVNNHAHVLKNKQEEISIDFLGYSLKYYDVTPFVSGTTRAKLNKSQAAQIPLSVPNLKTQQKIVERLDSIRKAQELCDTQIQKTEELFEALILKEFKNLKNEKYKSLPEVANLQRGKFTPRPRNDPKYFGGGIPWIQTGDVTNSSGEISNYSQTLNEQGLRVSRIFKKGTIVITIAANIGDLAILNIDAAFPDSLVGISANEKLIDNKFLYYQMLLQKTNLNNQATTAAQKNINLQVLSRVDIFVPKLETQQKVVEKLDAVQNYKKLLLKQKELLKELFDSVLYKSMHGEMD